MALPKPHIANYIIVSIKGVLSIKNIAFRFLLIACLVVLLVGCSKQDSSNRSKNSKENTQTPSNHAQIDEHKSLSESVEYINKNGLTLNERVITPFGFARTSYPTNSFGEFVRNYPLKPDGTPVLLYNGNEKGNQNAHIAVLDMVISQKDLQQCADSIIRFYAEYFYENKQYYKIKFHFVSGFLCDYEKWRDGYRIKINGNAVTWNKSAQYSDSKETFENYLESVFCYASTLSLKKESQDIDLAEMQIGDIFINPGSPGHVVMVVDMCENENGEKAFLLAQGYMPAQEFHILKNPSGENNPWYYTSEMEFPFATPEYSFKEGSFKRVEYNK